jgi:hypothetical protein
MTSFDVGSCIKLDENGKVTMDLLKAWNEKFLPKEVHEYSENIISGCIEEYGETIQPDLDEGLC